MTNAADLFDLQANPAAIDALEDAWKAQVKQLSWAADTINGAANRVMGGEAWLGETADRYDQHRRKLIADLDSCAELVGKVARALGECAQILRSGQDQLTTERQKLVKIRSDNAGGKLTFYPQDEQQKNLVENATQAANEIRSRVDSGLNGQAATFNSALNQLRQWQENWSGRTLKMLNLNIQQGGEGNSWKPWNNKGTEEGDIAPLAQRLVDNKIDVATLQETYKGDMDTLRDELNKKDPNGNWELRFGPAKENKMHFDDVPGPDDFGNAVFVRTGDGLTASPTQNHDLGDKGDEHRAAAETEIHIR
jgi:hypothetical protein